MSRDIRGDVMRFIDDMPVPGNTSNLEDDTAAALSGLGLPIRHGQGFDYGTLDGLDIDKFLEEYLAYRQENGNLDEAKDAFSNWLNRRLQTEQREYDLPSSQLKRLMDTGLSRQAALEMLGGSSGTGGSAAPQPAVSNAMPSQTKLNEIQGKTAIANTVFNGLQTLTSLASFGMSVPGTLSSTALSQLSLQQAQLAFSGITAAGNLVGSISSAVDTGVKLSKDDYKDAASMSKWMRSITPEQSPQLAQYVQSGQFSRDMQNPYFSDAVFSKLKNYQDTGTTPIKHGVDNALMDNYIARTLMDGVRTENIIQSTANLVKEAKRIDSLIENINQDTELKKAQEGNIAYLNDLYEAESMEVDSRRDLNEQQYDMQAATVRAYNLNADDLTGMMSSQLSLQIMKWVALSNNPAAVKDAVDDFILDIKNRRALAYWDYMVNNLSADFVSDPANTDLVKCAAAYNKLNLQNIYTQESSEGYILTPIGRFGNGESARVQGVDFSTLLMNAGKSGYVGNEQGERVEQDPVKPIRILK